MSWIVTRFGSWNATVTRFRGEILVPNPPVYGLGLIQPGTEKEFGFEIQNITDSSVEIVGVDASCSCVTTTSLPMTIAPGERKPLAFRATFPASDPGRKSFSIMLLVNRAGPMVVLKVEWEQTSEAMPGELPHPVAMPSNAHSQTRKETLSEILQ